MNALKAAASTGSSRDGCGGFGGPGCFCTDMSSCTCGGRGQYARTSEAEIAGYWTAKANGGDPDGIRAPPGLGPYGKAKAGPTTVVTPQKQSTWFDPIMSTQECFALSQGSQEDRDTTGLSQDMAQLQTNGTATGHVAISVQVLTDFIEQEILQHFDLVQAVQATRREPDALAIVYPRTWKDLSRILKKMAYDPWTQDVWKKLGFAMFEGDTPTKSRILARARTGVMLCRLADKASWSQGCRDQASEACALLEAAGRDCCVELPSCLAARKLHKLDKNVLPLFKELGAKALEHVRSSSEFGEEVVLTQWSDVLQSGAATPELMQQARSLATQLEKGSIAGLEAYAGQSLVAWMPADNNAATRVLGHIKACTAPNKQLA